MMDKNPSLMQSEHNSYSQNQNGPQVKYARPHYSLGKALAKKGEWEEAIASYQKAIELAPHWEEVRQCLADAENKLQEKNVNGREEKQAGGKMPHYKLGKILAGQGEWEEAIACYRKSIEVNPHFADVYHCLGDALVETGEKDEAIRVYQKAVEIEPHLWEVQHKLGNLLQEVGQFDEAVGAYQKSIELKSDFCWSYNNLGDVLVKLERWQEAAAAYGQAVELNPDFAWGHYKLGDALVELEEWEGAIASYRQGVAMNPQAPWSLYQLGELLRQQGQFEEAVGYLRQAVEINADVPKFYLALGATLVKLGQWLEAEDCLYQVLKSPSKDISKIRLEKTSLSNSHLAEAYYYLGVVKHGQEQWSEAVQLYRQSLALNPGQTDCCLSLAEAFGKLDKWSEAVEYYRRAMLLSDRSGEIVFRLGQALEQLQKWAENVKVERGLGLIADKEEDFQGEKQGYQKVAIKEAKITVFLPYYKAKNQERQDELIYCLKKNIECGEIEKIVLMIDDNHVPEVENSKIEVVNLTARPTYLDWVELTEKKCSNKISILANTDIYFDESVTRIREVFVANPQAFVALSRYEKEENKQTLHENPHWSQDVWAVCGEYNFADSFKNYLRIPLGVPRCDNKIAYLFAIHGAKIYNPCYHIKTTHLQKSGYRNYDKDVDTTIVGGTAWVYPNSVVDEPSKLQVELWTLNSSDFTGVTISEKGKSKETIVVPTIGSTSYKKAIKPNQESIESEGNSGEEKEKTEGGEEAIASEAKALEIKPKLKDVRSRFEQSTVSEGNQIWTIVQSSPENPDQKKAEEYLEPSKRNSAPTISNLVCGKYKTYPDLTGKRQTEGGLRLSQGNKRGTPEEPLVSIITAVYNNSTTFERCINSVTNQKYPNIEYIVIDGGSDLPTLDIIRKYSHQIDYFVSEPDGGIYNAMNKGLELAQGDYISVLNSDDWYSPDFVSLCVEMARSKGSSVVYTYCNHGDEQWMTPGMNEGIFLGHLNINHASFLVSRDCYNRIGRYSEKHRIVSDMLWKREAFKKGEQFDLVKEFLFNFSHGGLSSGSNVERKELMLSEIVKITRDIFEFLEEKEAINIYNLRFDKNKILGILTIINKYSDEELFISSLSKYIDYCFKYRNNFRLSHTESNTLFPVFIKVSEQLSIPKSSIRINTKYGDFSKIVESIDVVAEKKKNTHGKVILHYVFNFSTPSETFIYDLLRRLEKNTVFDNYILYDNRLMAQERPYEKGLHIHWAAFRDEIRNELYKYIFKRIEPDVVIAHFAVNEWKLRKRINPLGISVPTISMTHGIDVFSMGDKDKQEYKKYLLEDFSKRENTFFTTVSSYLKKELENHGIPNSKIAVVHNTVHDRFFAHRKKSNYFKKDRTLNLLNIGRLIDWKGHVYLLQALKYFKENCYDNIRLTIVYGKGEDYYEQTVAEIEKLNLASQVSLIPFVDFSKEPEFFHSFDIYIQSSTYSQDKLKKSETFGVAVLEAIAAGLPVIVTDAGGLPEVVGYQNKFAKIVPHGDGLAIGRALQEFFENEECFADNSEYARERLSFFSNKKQSILLAKEIIKVSQSKLNAALFSSATIQGAGYAAFRVHKGLRFTNINPTIYTKAGQHKNYPNVKVVPNPTPNVNSWDAWNILQQPSISKPELTIFTLNHPFITSKQLKSMVKEADVINLHWAARFLSVENVAQLSHIGKPLVITIRDMNPFTGGCHYFHGCKEWQNECKNCPQLVDTFDDFPSKVLKAKRRYYNFKNITIVTISKHTAEIVKRVPYFNQCRIEVIINSIETDVFKPHNKIEARKLFGLPLDRKIIGYVPSFSSTVKGYKEAIAAFEIIMQKYKDLNPFVMLLGNPTPANDAIKFDNKSIGYIDDNTKLAVAYSAADVTIVPSLEETFSNTTAESISCGTPVVGFQTGAIADMAQDGVTGYTFPIGDVEGLAEGIYKTLTEGSMSQNCREYAEKHLSFLLQARRYEELFYELYTYNKMLKVSNSQLFPSYFTETTPTIMNLLVSQLLNQPS